MCTPCHNRHTASNRSTLRLVAAIVLFVIGVGLLLVARARGEDRGVAHRDSGTATP